jgi:hypothetical protein
MVFSEPSWRIVNYIWVVRIKEPPRGICEPGSEADPPISSVPHRTGIALIDIICEVQMLGSTRVCPRTSIKGPSMVFT